MKILTFCQYYYPEDFQVTPICEQLVADGHEVTVVTGLPNYPTGVIPDEYKHGHRDEVINGVHIIRCHEIGRKKGAVHLALNYISYVRSASKKVKELPTDFDIIFVYQLSPVLMALPALKYKKKHDIPMLLYCCDLWPESMKVYVHSESNPAFKWVKRISKKIYTAADMIACQSTSFLTYMESTHAIRKEKLTYIPAFADETYLAQDFSPEGDTVDFVFLGNLGIAQNLLDVLQAIEKIRDISGFRVHFVGDGSVLDEMKAFVAEHRLDDIITFYGRRPMSQMPEFYKLADACLVSLKADNQTGLTLPTKVQGYMAAGKTILAMLDGSAKKVIEDAKCGLVAPAGDIHAYAKILKEFIVNKDKYKCCGENGRKYFVHNFTKEICMKKIENEIERIAGR